MDKKNIDRAVSFVKKHGEKTDAIVVIAKNDLGMVTMELIGPLDQMAFFSVAFQTYVGKVLTGESK